MTAAALLQDLRAAGVAVYMAGDRLRVDGPEHLVTPEVLERVRDAKPELVALLAAPVVDTPAAPPRAWPPEVADLAAWLATVAPAELPPTPFVLKVGIRVVDGPLFLATLQADVAVGPAHPRARFGALQDDVRALHALLSPCP